MAEQQLQSRPLYGIGTVARLTGLKPDTLRVWERRYDLGASQKSDTGRRQYTQADLEHLQLVAALVRSGARIGEIAASERKTLERLVEACTDGSRSPAVDKPQVVFVGEAICNWLEEHQGCLSGVSAHLAASRLEALELQVFEELGEIDLLVVGCDRMGGNQFRQLSELRQLLQPASTLVLQAGMSDNWLEELASEGIATMEFPPDRAELAFHLTRSSAERATRDGINSLAELVASRPRLHSAGQLDKAATLTTGVACECPQHLASLIAQLAEFEAYSAECSVDNWHDAAVHSCIYAYTSQSRWLMEKALDLVLQSHEQEQEEMAAPVLKSA
ncbi:MerR family transcriptional regulator [Seongchinamella sediminis]|uniref:MerR family transcriptional regulator n=1 Tax=Seongchinamella sediminis TaxID=2283635 RepID=A0A3L7E2J2_9GAMM|nr:MerR family transcriptional regulator [Seongchinamella sediminis]RLQ23075.1 MerR family transcriptional regulator [Seongchinamella sediminis]